MKHTLATLILAAALPSAALAQCDGTLNYWGIWTADTSADCWWSVGLSQAFDGESTGTLCPPCELACAQTISADLTFQGNPNNDGGPAGFTIGYQPNDFMNPNADYLLVVWPPVTQPDPEGNTRISLYRVQGEFDGPVGFGLCNWFNNVTLIATAPAGVGERPELGNDENNTQVWQMSADIGCDNITVRDGNTVLLDVDSATPGGFCQYVDSGRFCWYSTCQKMEVTPVTFEPVEIDANWFNYGNGLAGCVGVPTVVMAEDPLMGTAPEIQIGNTTDMGSSSCAMVWGIAQDNLFIPFLGGDLLIASPFAAVVSITVPSTGYSFNCTIPDECDQLGEMFYLQVICADPCGPAGFSMSDGLCIEIGNI